MYKRDYVYVNVKFYPGTAAFFPHAQNNYGIVYLQKKNVFCCSYIISSKKYVNVRKYFKGQLT